MFVAKVCSFDKPDRAGDVIRRGAFSATIRQHLLTKCVIPVVYSHQWSDPAQHVGEVKPTDLVETATGLQATGTFYLHEANSAKVFQQVKRRALSHWSIGFIIEQSTSLSGGARDITQCRPDRQLGPTLRGMGSTETVAVKADLGTDVAARRQALARCSSRRIAHNSTS